MKLQGVAKFKFPVLLIIAVLIFGFSFRYLHFQQAKKASQDQSVRVVSIVRPNFGKTANSLSFPGRLEGFKTAAIHSRVNGYLKGWNRDIGSRVRAGDVLGQIESPEVDQQYQQAKSDLLAATSNEELAEITYSRWANLFKVDAVSKQEVDQKQAELESKRALRRIAESNLERAKIFVGYENIPAPFDGVVTERNTDIGALISNGGGKPLFVVTDIDKLRLYIQLPQIYLNDIKPGLQAEVTVPEYPNAVFKASVSRSSGSVNEASGGSLVEIQIDNKDHKLTAGEYARVSVNLPFDAALLRVPASCLIVHKEGTFLAEVDAQHTIQFKPVKVMRDFGQEIEITGDFTDASLIVNAPSDTLVAGESVKVAAELEKTQAKADH